MSKKTISKKTMCIVLVASALSLGGCSHQGQKEQAGTAVGGVLGGVLGSQVGGGTGRTAAIIAGTLLGAHIGSSVGQSMDQTDRLRTAQTLETARTGESSQWRNPDTGNQYTVVPTRTYDAASGPCREYTMDAKIGGRTEQVYGTACRTDDGNWQIQK
ncbi:MAG: RT0821/Lpp0805 family surface protein [Porticoccaceae bacterium]